MIYLSITAQDLFYVVQAQDMFVYDSFYFQLLAEQPGFLVPYIGSFFTQFAYYPLLGIMIFVLLLTLLAYLVKWAIRVPAHLSSLTLLPSVLLVMAVLRWDYGIYASRHYGSLYAPIIGLILVMMLVGLFVNLKSRLTRYVLVGVTILLFYPFLGFYSLMAVTLMIIVDLALLQRRDWILYVISVIMMGFVPPIMSRFFFVKANMDFAWISALPHFDYFKQPDILYPLYAALFVTIITPIVVRFLKSYQERYIRILSLCLFVTAMILVPVYSNRDTNFHTLLAIDHAYGVGKDEKVLDLCAAQERPIRSIIMYRNIELYKRGELLDRMFQFTWHSDTIQSLSQRMNTFISGPRVMQKYTFWNFSYRRAMERFVKYNPSYVDVQIMATDILYNQEPDLANKYLTMLEHTLFYHDWAKKQRRLMDENELKADSLFKLHRQIVVVPPGSLDNTEYCEYLLLKHFTHLYINTEKRAELSIAASMVLCNEDVFWQLTLALYKAHPDRRLPRHVQEAALLFALKHQNKQLLSQIELMVGAEGAVCQQFRRNQDLFVRLLTQPTQVDVSTLAALCPGTYWNYYFNESRQMVVYD